MLTRTAAFGRAASPPGRPRAREAPAANAPALLR